MEKSNKTILNVIKAIPKIIFIMILVFLTCASLVARSDISVREVTVFNIDHWFINILICILFIALIVLIKQKQFKVKDKYKKIFFIALVLIWICCAIGFIIILKVKPRADQKYIYNAAIGIATKDYHSFVGKGYINQNPQQQGMVLLEYILSIISTKHLIYIVQFVNVFALLAAFLVIYKITNMVFEDKKISNITSICMLTFIPIFCYITFMYGNIIGLLFSMTAVLFELKYFKNRKWYFTVISGAFIGLAVITKSNYLVSLIAMLIMYFIDILENKKYRDIIAMIIIIVMYIFINFIVKFSIKQLTGANIEKGIPMTAYVAMGMQEGRRAPGWYNAYNRRVYKNSNYNFEVANNSSKEEIRNRINVFKGNIPYAIDFYTKKILSQWNNPTFQGFWINRIVHIKYNDTIYEKTSISETNNTNTIKTNTTNTTQSKAKKYKAKGKAKPQESAQSLKYKNTIIEIITEYTKIFQILVLVGATAYSILNYKNIKSKELFFMIIFIGGFLFHIIWEAKCQYTITYFILLIPYSVKGFDILSDLINKKINKKKSTVH